MIVNEYAFGVLEREHERQLTIELERRRVQLERAAEAAVPAQRHRGHRLLSRGHVERPAERHAH
jgi:hypothetical protein